MPWKKTSKQEQRFDLVRQMISGLVPVRELCRRFKIVRQTACKWLNRYREKRLDWYRTGKGLRVEPLTVRDLFSRYGLLIALLRRQTVAQTRREFARLFALYGLPLCIRCDNGSPFGGSGPTGLTRLSAWWVKLGIEVDFTTPGCPYENGAHEQFHRIYKAEVGLPA